MYWLLFQNNMLDRNRLIYCFGLLISNCIIVFYSSECLADQHRCEDGACIPSSYMCDGRVQCPLGEDEYNCGGWSLHFSHMSQHDIF